MIDLSPPFYEVSVTTRETADGKKVKERVLVFRDHADAELFHVLPPSPRLALRAGAPIFQLLLYRFPPDTEEGARGGGMALFEVEAGLSTSQLDAVAREVSQLSGVPAARVLPVVFAGGTVRAIIAQRDAEDADRFIETLMDVRPAPPLPPYPSAFALSLSPEGASLIRQAVMGDELPVGVAYELRFDALLPALHARIRLDYERAYDRFAASIGLEYQAVRVELGAELAWLRDNGILDVEITSFTSGEDRARQEQQVMALVQARVEQDFFRSAMPQKQKAGGGLSQLLTALFGGEGEPEADSAMFVLKAKYEMERELRVFEQHFDRRAAQSLTHVSTGFLWGMHAGQPPRILELDLQSDFFARLQLKIIGAFNFDTLPDLQRVAVHVEHPLRGDTFVFERGSAQVFDFGVPLSEGAGYRWRATFSFDPGVGHGPATIEVGPFDANERILAVSSDLVDYRRVRLAAAGAFDQVARYRLHLRVPGDEGASDRITPFMQALDAEQPEQLITLRLPRTAARAELRVRLEAELPSGSVIAHDEALVHGNTFVVSPAEVVAQRTVRVLSGADWELVQQVIVDVRHTQGGAPQEATFAFAKDGASSAEWIFVKHEPTASAWQLRQIIVRRDGTTAEHPWTDTDDASVVVGALPDAGDELRIVAVGDFGDALGLQVDVWPLRADGSDGQQQSLFLRNGQAEERVLLEGSDGVHYRYEVWRITADGKSRVDAQESRAPLLVVRAFHA
jgi:hypothetical protein